MMNITVNTKNATIEMTKTFAKAASRFGSPEYDQLQTVRRDYPNYRVVTKSTKSGDHYKGLNTQKMYDYIIKSSNENKDAILDEFCEIAGWNKTTGKRAKDAEHATIGELKMWFFDTFPEVKEVRDQQKAKISSVMDRVRANQAAKKAA